MKTLNRLASLCKLTLVRERHPSALLTGNKNIFSLGKCWLQESLCSCVEFSTVGRQTEAHYCWFLYKMPHFFRGDRFQWFIKVFVAYLCRACQQQGDRALH